MEFDEPTWDRKQEVAFLLKFMEVKATHLIAAKRDELRELLVRDNMTFGDVGAELLSNQFEGNYALQRGIVRYAARQLLSEEEYKVVVKKNRGLAVKKLGGGELWTEAEIAFIQKLIIDPAYLHPIGTINAGQPNYQKIINALNAKFYEGAPVRACRILVDMICHRSHLFQRRKRGKAWSEAELQRLIELRMDKSFHHHEGLHIGSPDWKLITLHINQEFHSQELAQGKEVRSQQSCSSKVKNEPEKKRRVRQWKDAEICRLNELATDPSNFNSGLEQSKKKGTLNWGKILEILNAEFPPDEKSGQLFTFPSCNNQLRRQNAKK